MNKTKTELLSEIEELREELANERERADILSDKLSQYEEDTHEDYTLIHRNDLESYQSNESKLDEISETLRMIEVCKWRIDLGIDYSKEELEKYREQLADIV